MRTMSAIICAGAIAACSAVNLESGAQSVRVVTNEPQGCEYLGEVTGSQGDLLYGRIHEQCESRDRRAERHEESGDEIRRQHGPIAHQPSRTDRIDGAG